MEISHKLHLETKAAEALKESIRAVVGDDDALLRDMMEAETDLRPMVARATEQIRADEALADGIADLVKKLITRKERIVQRGAMMRAACLTAMAVAEIKTLETPAGTLTRKPLPQSAIVLDEAVIPSEFWKAQEPKLDNRALLDALKSGRAVEGAQLSNGGETIQIRN